MPKVLSFFPKGTSGFGLYTLTLFTLALIVVEFTLLDRAFDPGTREFILIIGGLALWRYSWGLLHFTRSLIYRRFVFPKLRTKIDTEGGSLMPSCIYLLITSFRIEPETTIRVYGAAFREALDCGVPVTIVPSIVDKADEQLILDLFEQMNLPERVKMHIVRIPGTGKRDGLAQAYRAISRDMPPPDSVVAVIDGDSILTEGLVRKTAPFFKLMPTMGGLTTDEDCEVKGSRIMGDWHAFRFAQRHISMSSWALSRKLSTLTGRMSMFRGSILTDPEFIREVEDDHVQHWRFGRLKFLTGDDKSSCFHLMKKGWDLLYVPDVLVKTVEHPPADNFFKASTLLMFRWSGNMLRTNGRLLKLGPRKTGFFIWWCILDQRITMWTSLSGPAFVAFLCMKYTTAIFLVYLVWIGFTRWVMTMMLLSARPVLNWTYPFLIYYTQIYGALIKTFVLFRLNRQSWTRQKTRLQSSYSMSRQRWIDFSSFAMHTVAVLFFVSVIGVLTGVFSLPKDIINLVAETLL